MEIVGGSCFLHAEGWTSLHRLQIVATLKGHGVRNAPKAATGLLQVRYIAAFWQSLNLLQQAFSNPACSERLPLQAFGSLDYSEALFLQTFSSPACSEPLLLQASGSLDFSEASLLQAFSLREFA